MKRTRMNVVAVRLNLMNSFWPYHMMVVTEGYAQSILGYQSQNMNCSEK